MKAILVNNITRASGKISPDRKKVQDMHGFENWMSGRFHLFPHDGDDELS